MGKLGVLPILLLLAGCSVPVASGLTDPDANEVLVALEGGNVAAQKEADPAAEGHYRVTVSRDDASAAITILRQENLPPPPAPGVLDTLGEGSLVPSRTAEHAKLIAGTSGDLERSLRGVSGVLDARVHLAVPVKGPLGEDDAPPPTASVLIRHRGATPPLSTQDIQRLVSGAVAGLSEKNVSVVMTSAPEPPHAGQRDLARFGPITVTRASMNPLRLLIGAAALLNVVLIGLLVALWARIRRTQNELSETRLSAEAAARDAR